jgi:hypothetical protein
LFEGYRPDSINIDRVIFHLSNYYTLIRICTANYQ